MKEVLQKFKDQKVLVLGEILLDRHILGKDATGSSREGNPNMPYCRYLHGKKNHKESYSPGCAGNIAQNLASLGAQVSVTGVIGLDKGDYYRGNILKDELNKRDIDTTLLLSSEKLKTKCYERGCNFEDASNPLFRSDIDISQPLPPELEQELISNLKTSISNQDAILVADYHEEGHPLITKNILTTLASFKDQIKTYGTSRNRIHLFKEFHCLVPNDNELVRATNIYKPKNFQEEIPHDLVLEAGKSFLPQTNPNNLVVTVGSRGAIFFDKKGFKHIPTLPLKDNIDVTGIGDTFLSGMVLAELSGSTKEQAIHIGNIAAGLTAKILGTTGTTTIEEIQKVLEK